MSNSESNGSSGSRRPLLSRGELLSTPAEKSGGGGEKFHPYSIFEAHSMLAPHAERLVAEAEALPSDLTGPHLVFEATLHPNYLASTYFPEDLLTKSDLYLVGVRKATAPMKTAKTVKESQPTKTLILAGPRSAVCSFGRSVALGPNKPGSASTGSWEQLRELHEVGLPRPDRIIVRRPPMSKGEAITWEAVLTQIGRSERELKPWAEEVFQKWVDLVRRHGGEVDGNHRCDLGRLTFVPVLLDGEALDRVAEFNLLRAIRPMPTIRPIPSTIVRSLPAAPKESRMASEGRKPAVRMAIFDGGVNDALPAFRPFVTTEHLTTAPPDAKAMQHGSLVTSAALYGALNGGADQLPDPTATITHYRVFPLPLAGSGKPDAGMYWLLDNIVETIRKDHLRLVSLSLGPDECVEDGAEPSRWTAQLDQVIHAEGVTIVVAAGNNGEDDAPLGLNRVQVPADMVNGIGVGACSPFDEKAKFGRVPYSAVGPGREGQRVQPTGVAFGGSVEEPFVGFGTSGRLAEACGTSFATPMVARAIAGLRGTIDQTRRRTEIDRSFVGHFARRLTRGHRTVELGHGRLPSTFEPHLECAANEGTILYEDQLHRGQIKALRFPLPNGLLATDKIDVEWTLTFLTEVDPRDASDYTRSGVEVYFRPNEYLRSLSIEDKSEKGRVVHVVRDKAEIKRALLLGWKLGEQPLAHSQWRAYRRESTRRLEGKWETIVRGRVSIAAGELYRPRLDVSYLRREGGQLVNGSAVPPLPIVALVTMRAPKGVPIYERITAQFDMLQPLIQLPLRV